MSPKEPLQNGKKNTYNGFPAKEVIQQDLITIPIKERPKMWDNAKSTIELYTAKGPDVDEVLKLHIAYMEKLTTLLEQRNIKFIIVITPTYHTFYENINKKQMQIIYQSVENLCKNHNNISFYDYFKDPRFREDDFYDANHLSDVGAEKFTKILRDTIFMNKK